MLALTLDVTLRQQAFVLHVRESASVEVLGLFGPSGSGKTSLLEAIAGIRTPDQGEIRVAERLLFSSTQRIKVLPRQRHIGYVPQDPSMFHRTVADNIRFGRPEATDEEVERAARMAHAAEFIDEFEDHPALLFYELANELNLEADMDINRRCWSDCRRDETADACAIMAR